jgi:DNA polymerase I-like protein with 3'-5' exonuclease and polymerase domains
VKKPKFNILALNRKEPLLMQAMVADPGHILVSADISAGEPSLTAHFSKDPNYYDCVAGMVGREPFYDSNGLRIDDIYLSVMSVSPIGRDTMAAIFDHGKDGTSFVDQWMRDKDVVCKKWLKRERDIHKILALGLAYGLSSPKSMQEHGAKAGYKLTQAECRAFKDAYWDRFRGVDRFSKSLIRKWQKDGYIVNPFGYRCLPDADYKVMNAFIQSSLSGLMKVLSMKFFEVCKYAEFIAVIHDEICMQIPIDRQEEAKKLWDMAVDSLNADLAWTVPIRTGWVNGKSLFEAK